MILSLIENLPRFDTEPDMYHYANIGNAVITYWIGDEDVHLISLRVPNRYRGAGEARIAMETFLQWVDKTLGLPVRLEASPLDQKTHLGKLVKFYQSLGFQLTGKTANLAGEPIMIRPKSESF